FQMDDNIPHVLLGDPYRLKQILYNLVGNAIKFTEEGFVEIKAKAFPKEHNAAELQVEVSDTGIGISPGKLESIFEGFYQSDSSVTRRFGGTGLGLTITKKLVELQNGSIEVKSEEGKGSTFSFRIPYLIGEETDVEEKISVPADPSALLGNISALVVDDEDYNRLLIETILSRWGMKVTVCDNGKKALREMESNHYDLVLMDVRMPEMSGLEVTERIRQMPGNKAQVPVLALTAASSEYDIRKCKIAGMNDILSKPFREAELFEKICLTMGIDFSRVLKPASGTLQADSEKIYDLSELKRLSNGDDKFVNEMLRVFIQNTQDGMKRLKEAIQKKDWEKTGLYAHRIAAPSRHLGMSQIVRKLKEIEKNAVSKTELESIKAAYESIEAQMQTALSHLQQETASGKN
ncbi:MAG TPA: ATP-binding protein, partial [Chitinophagales bacterium]|nr:ATP-binding protein [Chitinophagales bacterium]